MPAPEQQPNKQLSKLWMARECFSKQQPLGTLGYRRIIEGNCDCNRSMVCVCEREPPCITAAVSNLILLFEVYSGLVVSYSGDMSAHAEDLTLPNPPEILKRMRSTRPLKLKPEE